MIRKNKQKILGPWLEGPSFNIAPNWERKPLEEGFQNDFGQTAWVTEVKLNAGKVYYLARVTRIGTRYRNSSIIFTTGEMFETKEQAFAVIDSLLIDMGFTLLDRTNLIGML